MAGAQARQPMDCGKGAPAPRGKRVLLPAFTLIELLVIVGILVVLVALLMPAFAKSRRQARVVGCLSNLRQLQLAFTSYVTTNQKLPAFDSKEQGRWLATLRADSPGIGDCRLCPEAIAPSYGWGSAATAWGPYDSQKTPAKWMSFLRDESSSYGFNGWLQDAPADLNASFLKPNAVNPQRIPVFADANWIEGFPTTFDAVPADLTRGAGFGEPSLGRFCITRHGHSINSVYLDGHAEQITLPRLWQLKWSANFVPRMIRIPGEPPP
ncbi:MAG TPA: hypothetical protein VFC78_11445 [Tepidisphaeraceae bacterium]|nr:hypothetical protein [Tepidisphaeraceae bacterium]